MNYKKFLDLLYKRHSPNVKLGLERIEKILKSMNSPNKKLPGIHVAGTNGKGSTCAICEALALASGLTTGMNISPHLKDYTERFRINGEDIDYKELLFAYKKWQKKFEKHKLSFFEISTAMAFYLFNKKKMEFSLFEVGMGGRLDATNPFIPTASIITSISYDHTKSLGDTLQKIAFEKSGIIKESVPVIVGKMPEDAFQIIEERAKTKGSPIKRFRKDFFATNIRLTQKASIFDYTYQELRLKNVKLNLLGRHQVQNASCALTAFVLFMKKTKREIDNEQIKNALSTVNWKGRMQVLSKDPTVILDGAHNQEGIETLIKNLKTIFPNKKFIFVISILKDKNLRKMLKDIADISYSVFITRNKSKRSASVETLSEVLENEKVNFFETFGVPQAYRLALLNAKRDDVVVVCGSLYTVGELL